MAAKTRKTDDRSSNRVRNTTELLKSDPRGSFFELAVGGIEGQERRGQTELLESTVLPSDFSGREVLEAAGLKFGAPVSGDPMFLQATLPAGWKKVRSDHAMWSYLHDERGRRRAAIFYKAASYDRSANAYAERRFSTSRDYDRKDAIVCRAMDGKERVLHETVTPADYSNTREWYRLVEVCEENMRAWMTERFPKWGDPGAYWDLPDDVKA